ncbi:MAG: hypothetical protein A2252_09955 [Elusimicrobia bacterium RIFOXYA2_FULL_39_19]|nr:MAG: hypothetical protein A2252_09955 [Elusimicrobia bacterium RIFOXYA2_FULL_39_19]
MKKSVLVVAAVCVSAGLFLYGCNRTTAHCPMMGMTEPEPAVSIDNKTENKKVSYVCPMHSDVTSDNPGKCSKCGMSLVQKK